MGVKKFPIKVGQEVFLCPASNYTRMGKKPRPGVITKIARKYFYVDIDSAWGEAKFEIETFQYAGDDCNSSWILYPNEETYLEEKRRQEKLQAIREYFRNWAREVPSEIVNGVYELIRAEVEMDAN